MSLCEEWQLEPFVSKNTSISRLCIYTALTKDSRRILTEHVAGHYAEWVAPFTPDINKQMIP